MARDFDGSTDYLTGIPGALLGMDAGPIAIAALLSLDANTPGGAIVYCGNGGGAAVSLEVYQGDYYLGSQDPALAAASTADGWHLIAVTKVDGSALPRIHKYVYGTNTHSHVDGPGTVGNGTAVVTGDTLQIGRWGTASTRLDGQIAIAAVWDRVLSDAETEQLPFSLQAWYASAPTAMWLLDQATATTDIADTTGGGANLTGGSGTSVAANSVPVFSYGFDIADLTAAIAAGPVAGSGRSTAMAISTATAAKVTPTAGRSVAVAGSTSLAMKVVAVTGRCSAVAVGRAAGTKTVAASATTAALTVSTAQAASKQVAATGLTAALAISHHSGSRAVTGRTVAIVRSLHRRQQPRPGTGSLTRPSDGTLARPYIGIVVRP